MLGPDECDGYDAANLMFWVLNYKQISNAQVTAGQSWVLLRDPVIQ